MLWKWQAATLGDTAMVKELLATVQGSQEKPRYGYPLLLVTHSGCVETVEHLLKEGADLTASIKRTEIEETPSIFPALVSAANGGSVAINSILLKEGAMVDLRCDTSGCTALKVPAGKGNPKLLELLLEGGANLNGRNDGGPIIAAAKWRKLRTVQALVENGACMDIANSKSETPIGVAASLNKKDVFAYLTPSADFRFALKTAFDEGHFYSQNQQHVGRVHSYSRTKHWHLLLQCNLAVLKYKSGSGTTDISTSWVFIFVLWFLSQLI
ncbi:uncharacterized protein N7446_010519 [Penicillium canescens]|uniref:Uncharacterized protein n=1 Tax=Penicillium canescens TaxID=5083 RepID=A0AAD6N892_PENCN|nr:uncharacterized protein N7446_010519 [Penicillium canescens]KAJ6041597.1 hypothetical protein N7460_006987 [Penicillium canescens]KAJ6050410.1 hypothetical protein N7446_010519 [Penicillium canescens]KAJ6064714.1 hypothetical protein N7444_000367 [Penicillium canescens]